MTAEYAPAMLSRLRVPALLVAFALALAGCSSGEGGGASESVTTTTGAAPTATQARTPPPDPEFTPIVGAVVFAPIPFAGSDDRNHLVYELSLTNYTGAPVTVTGVRVVDPDSDEPIATFDEAAVASRLKPTGTPTAGTAPGAPPGYSNVLAGGQNGMLFLHVVLDPDDPIPATIAHDLDMRADAAPPGFNELTERRIAESRVDERTLPVLGPPLRGTNYIAADACCDAVRHTRAVLPIDGQPYLAQRYAVDWEQADDSGHIYVGDAADPDSYLIFGDDVLAVADGTVVQSRNDLAEQTPGRYPEGLPLADADGNNLVLDIGDGFYVNYAHMQPDSVLFGPGDTVRKGDVIGKVGNTGNSVAPHLHVHVMDGPSFLAAQGLPSLTESFTVTDRVASTADFDAAEGQGVPLVMVPGVTPAEHRDQMVLDQYVVTFE
ncbi:MAG TPA: M23 family metallopeptidase [Aldersonia sp.]